MTKNTNEPEVYYQISFDSNGGNNVEDFKVADGKITKLPVSEREGYKFLGWFDGENEIKVGDTISKNISLTAKWEKIENETKPTESTKPTTPTETQVGEEVEFTIDLIADANVYNYETKEQGTIYNFKKLNGYDKYDIYLSGATPLIEISNANNKTIK